MRLTRFLAIILLTFSTLLFAGDLEYLNGSNFKSAHYAPLRDLLCKGWSLKEPGDSCHYHNFSTWNLDLNGDGVDERFFVGPDQLCVNEKCPLTIIRNSKTGWQLVANGLRLERGWQRQDAPKILATSHLGYSDWEATELANEETWLKTKYVWDGKTYRESGKQKVPRTSHLLSNPDGSPKLPYIRYEFCEGESQMGPCTLVRGGFFTSNKPFKVYAKPLDKKPAATIGKDQKVEALTWSLYTVKTQACKVLANEEGIKKGEKFYPLFYAGEGWVDGWCHGKMIGLWAGTEEETQYQCPKKSEAHHVEYWTKIKYKGKIYWWVAPDECLRAAEHPESCPLQ